MTFLEFKEFLDSFDISDDSKRQIAEAASDCIDEEIELAEDDFECDGRCGRVDPDDVLSADAYNDLDECIRVFDSNPRDAKYLLSRALKEIPGAPKWLD